MEDNKVMDVLNEIKTLVDESNGTMEDLGKQLSEAVQNADLEAAKKLLEEKITQQDIATALGITRQSVRGLLMKKNFSLKDAQKILDLMNSPLEINFRKNE